MSQEGQLGLTRGPFWPILETSPPVVPTGILAPFRPRSEGSFFAYAQSRLPRRRVQPVPLAQTSDDLEGASTRWLDLRSLLTSYLPLFGKEAVLGRIYYFSALAHHLEKDSPGIVRRHQLYIEAIRSTGVRPVMGGFKKMNPMRCTECSTKVSRREEKKSDVAMAVTLLERLVKDDADLVVLVTGDTDQVPALHAAKTLCPTKAVHCAFPYQRKNNELEREADGSFKMSRDNYCKHQFPEKVALKSGRELARPLGW